MKPIKLLILLIALILQACERNSTDIGGKGGKSVLKVIPKHHDDRYIENCTIYIEYNTNDKPSDNKYDDSVLCVNDNGQPVATFSNLKKGKYYLFGQGFDPKIAESVTGGAPYIIKDESVLTYYITTDKHGGILK